MKRMAAVGCALMIVAIVAMATPAHAQVQYNVVVTGEIVKGSPNDHFLTFDVPVRVPDAMLPAGTYIFTMVGPSTIQVSTADRSQQLAMFFTVPVERSEAAPAYQVTLARTPAEREGRITRWFLPNKTVGLEFLYDTEELRGER